MSPLAPAHSVKNRNAKTRALKLASGVAPLAIAAIIIPTQASAAPSISTRVAAYSAGPSTVKAGQTITVKGQLQKYQSRAWRASAGSLAVVYFDPDGARPNAAVRTIRSDARGNFSTGFRAQVSGKWMVRLSQNATLKTSATSQRYVRVVVPAPARPASVRPSGWVCPSWAPIKGNASSRIFHVPGGRYYVKTKPEMCFANATAAIRAGYRQSKA